MTKEERREKNKIINKGRRWYAGYLANTVTKDMTEENRLRLISVMSEKYRYCMRNDDVFFDSVREFTGIRRKIDEKNDYFRRMTTFLVQTKDVEKTFAERYPDEYRVRSERS